MSTRRSFLSRLAVAASVAPVLNAGAVRRLLAAEQIAGTRSALGLADDEDYWGEIQRAFDADHTVINLNNGGVSPAPTHVLDAMIRDLRFSNEMPVEHMWGILEPRIETVRRDLANDFGCDPEELALTRNASEANETMIFGLDLSPGDEVIVSTQNYGRMLTTWEQRERRHGIVIRRVTIPPKASDAEIVARFKAAVTPRTKAIEVMHISYLTGQIWPVQALVAMGRAQGIPVFVDGAHAYAHFPFTRDSLGADYYGTSLHKWLHAPIGTGFLYVRRDRIPGLWPLMAADKSQTANIRKFEEVGTHPAANHNAIGLALAFHRSIGAERKWRRLRWLTQRWAAPLRAQGDRVIVHTPLDDERSGAIALVQLAGVDTGKLREWLWRERRIFTVLIKHQDFEGLRVTPSVYTTRDDVDRFAEAMTQALRKGLPA
ncbi:MAG: aminotransferase class V-fold PLP-dependent enzyme [Gemmatimonadaceae bacterium]|nr:aminotransferase class V-fold PLP-dependent enzyme [Gemmatimonadaceae bacterium]